MRSYFLVAIGLLGGELVDGDFVGGEIVWWRDEEVSLLRTKIEWGFRIYRIFQDRVPGL